MVTPEEFLFSLSSMTSEVWNKMQPSQDMQDLEYAPMGSGKRVHSAPDLFFSFETYQAFSLGHTLVCNECPSSCVHACKMRPDFSSIHVCDPTLLVQYAQKGYAKKGYKAPGKMRRLA